MKSAAKFVASMESAAGCKFCDFSAEQSQIIPAESFTLSLILKVFNIYPRFSAAPSTAIALKPELPVLALERRPEVCADCILTSSTLWLC